MLHQEIKQNLSLRCFWWHLRPNIIHYFPINIINLRELLLLWTHLQKYVGKCTSTPLLPRNKILPALPVTMKSTELFWACSRTTNKPGYILNVDNYVNNDIDVWLSSNADHVHFLQPYAHNLIWTIITLYCMAMECCWVVLN